MSQICCAVRAGLPSRRTLCAWWYLSTYRSVLVIRTEGIVWDKRFDSTPSRRVVELEVSRARSTGSETREQTRIFLEGTGGYAHHWDD